MNLRELDAKFLETYISDGEVIEYDSETTKQIIYTIEEENNKACLTQK